MTDRSAMIRVDQAGEYGATRIYAGQLAVMGDRAPHSGEIRAMADQEAGHLAAFDALIAVHRHQFTSDPWRRRWNAPPNRRPAAAPRPSGRGGD